MKIRRTALTVLVAGCALSASAMAQPVGMNTKAKQGIYTLPAAKEAARVVPTFQILPNGQRIPVVHNPSKPAPRGATVGFNNQDCEGCAAASDVPDFGLNVAYVQPGSYDGTNPSTQASLFGLGDGPVGSSLRAPSAPTATPIRSPSPRTSSGTTTPATPACGRRRQGRGGHRRVQPRHRSPEPHRRGSDRRVPDPLLLRRRS